MNTFPILQIGWVFIVAVIIDSFQKRNLESVFYIDFYFSFSVPARFIVCDSAVLPRS